MRPPIAVAANAMPTTTVTSDNASARAATSLANSTGIRRGDNVNVSRDSREYGAVPRPRVVGRVVYRYLPGARRGRLSASR